MKNILLILTLIVFIFLSCGEISDEPVWTKYDPNLKSKGSGAVTGEGEVVGIAVATYNNKWYFPIAHKEGPNMDRKKTLEWFKDILECPATKIFHNAMYDVCWIRNLGLKINGLIVDTMIASSLLDENRFSYTPKKNNIATLFSIRG